MDYAKWSYVNKPDFFTTPDVYHYTGVIASEDYPNHLFGNRSTLIMLMNMPDHTYVTLTLQSPVHLLANQKLRINGNAILFLGWDRLSVCFWWLGFLGREQGTLSLMI